MDPSTPALTPSGFPGVPAHSDAMRQALQQSNTATVWPGQASYSTIQAAIDSIGNASESQPYQITIGPGTYTEQVTLKPWVSLMGAGPDSTTITYAGTPQEQGGASSGVVLGASNSAVFALTIYCTGGAEANTYSQALYCAGANPFYCQGVTLLADDSAGGAGASNIVQAVTNGYDSSSLNNIIIGQCTITATAAGEGSGARALSAQDGATYQVDLCVITATRNLNTTNGQAWGALASMQATLSLIECTVTGHDYAVNVIDATASATDCTLNGPVSADVQIINNQ